MTARQYSRVAAGDGAGTSTPRRRGAFQDLKASTQQRTVEVPTAGSKSMSRAQGLSTGDGDHSMVRKALGIGMKRLNDLSDFHWATSCWSPMTSRTALPGDGTQYGHRLTLVEAGVLLLALIAMWWEATDRCEKHGPIRIAGGCAPPTADCPPGRHRRLSRHYGDAGRTGAVDACGDLGTDAG